MVESDIQVLEYFANIDKVQGLIIILVQIIIGGSRIENGSQYRITVEGAYHLHQNRHKLIPSYCQGGVSPPQEPPQGHVSCTSQQ